uniref:Tc1-like transposase DDE domain-containing protein n=1 Tax=Oncorhynchus tshawytscha TaxID=74940 RepID=A0AAZ3NQG7_ONCTS
MIAKEMEKTTVSGLHLQTMGKHGICDREKHPTMVYKGTVTQHTSKLSKGYLTEKEIDGVLHHMAWPTQSPNLNPIEMVWHELDCRLKEKQPTSAEHMWELLQDC